MDFKSNVGKIEKIIGYTFKDKSLLAQAFTRTSFCNEHKTGGNLPYQSNEVLEFFGDGVLSVAIITFLMREHTKRYQYGIYTGLNEGSFSNIKSKLSDKTNLSRSMSNLGLQKYLRLGEGDVKLGIADEPSVMEDLFESIIGAVYIDCNMDMQTVMGVVANMLDISEYMSTALPIQSSKNALQEFCADKKRRMPQPVYETLSESGPDHKKTFVRGCYIGERLVAKGEGKNRKIADAIAAEQALKILVEEENKANAKSVKSADKKAKITQNANKSVQKSAKTKLKVQSQDKKEVKKAVALSPAKPSSNAVILKKKVKGINVTKDSSASVRLKSYAIARKCAMPMFRDLTEVGSNGVYKVECKIGDMSSVATGKTRSDARESAASILLKKLK